MAVSRIDEAGLNVTQYGNRNLIINGAMTVAQRGTSFTPSAATTTYTLDRFSFYQNAGTVGVDQVTDSPDGFEYSLKCEVDTTGSVASGTILQIGQPIEGYNLTPLDWNGGSNAQPATASFWVKSSKAGVYGFRIRLGGAGTFIKEFTVNASNTWEYKTIAIPACPYTVPNKTNGTGIFIGIQLVSGSTYYAASDGVWQTADAYGTSGMDNDWITTSGATFHITGVQLEVGDTATGFEHRSYGDELARCQRYYEQKDYLNTSFVSVGYSSSGASPACMLDFNEKRVAPTITLPSAGNSTGEISFLTGVGGYASTIGTHSIQTVTLFNCRIQGAGYGGLTAAQPSPMFFTGSASIKIDAEL